jgi:uncharacterized protein YkwD
MSAMIPRYRFLVGAFLLAMLPLAWADDKKEPEFRLTKEEQELIDATNAARVKQKLPPLKMNPLLTKTARQHSANMAKLKMMAHELDGKTPDQRVDDAGYDYAKCNENIGWWPEKNAKQVIDDFLTSKVHRDNILGSFEDIGVGYAPGPRPRTGEKGFYVTQLFGTLRKKQ